MWTCPETFHWLNSKSFRNICNFQTLRQLRSSPHKLLSSLKCDPTFFLLSQYVSFFDLICFLISSCRIGSHININTFVFPHCTRSSSSVPIYTLKNENHEWLVSLSWSMSCLDIWALRKSLVPHADGNFHIFQSTPPTLCLPFIRMSGKCFIKTQESVTHCCRMSLCLSKTTSFNADCIMHKIMSSTPWWISLHLWKQYRNIIADVIVTMNILHHIFHREMWWNDGVFLTRGLLFYSDHVYRHALTRHVFWKGRVWPPAFSFFVRISSVLVLFSSTHVINFHVCITWWRSPQHLSMEISATSPIRVSSRISSILIYPDLVTVCTPTVDLSPRSIICFFSHISCIMTSSALLREVIALSRQRIQDSYCKFSILRLLS